MKTNTSIEERSNSTIRVSLGWVLIVFVLVLVIGAIGGIIGTSVIRPPLPPLNDQQDQLISNVQEITISPSKAAAKLVSDNERAVLLLASGEVTASPIVGIVLTNDGLIVSATNIQSSTLYAFDSTGTRISINRVGTDELYSLTYYRLSGSVIPPFALANQDPEVGSSMLALSRHQDSFTPRATSKQILNYQLPTAGSPVAWQKLGLIPNSTVGFNGAALINDEGQLAGIISEQDQLILPVSAIKSSFNRVTSNKREVNPLTGAGLRLTYEFRFNEKTSKQEFQIVISAVTPSSPAAIAGLRVGDGIKTIDETDLVWGTDIINLLDTSERLDLKIIRDGTELPLVLNPTQTQS